MPTLSIEKANGPLKQDIGRRFLERSQAERYRDRFKTGRHQGTHRQEAAALESLLRTLGKVNTALDVACGPGRFAYILKDHARTLVQMDLSRHMLDLSREDYPLTGLSGGYVQADAGDLPLADNSVDVVFCHRFLNHISDRRQRLQVLRELTRVTRQYVVASCLGLPRMYYIFRRMYGFLRGSQPANDHVMPADFLADGKEAGLVLVLRTPIRLMGMAAYFTFVKHQA
jgi:ubiquinone/menaquinone biosynthesis C-methylase UbiE